MKKEKGISEFYIHIQGPDFSQETRLAPGISLIGREEGCDILLAHPSVSPLHAELIVDSSECQITDLGNQNPTQVNGRVLEPHIPFVLPVPATIQIGSFEITLHRGEVNKPEREPVAEPKPQKQPVVLTEITPLLIRAEQAASTDQSKYPPGLNEFSRYLLQYLPAIYHTEFMSNFLALFESILLPIEWKVDNFDLYLDPGTSPAGFLPWLANWFEIAADPAWDELQRRTILKETANLYARRGTRWALTRVLEILTGHTPEIIEFREGQDPFTFTVKLPVSAQAINQQFIERVVAAYKPAHTRCILNFGAKHE